MAAKKEKKKTLLEKVVRKTPSGAPIFNALDKIRKATEGLRKNKKRKTSLRKKGS